MPPTCETCGAPLALGNDVEGRCQECGSQFYRRDPVPTRSNMELRNMVSPGEEDQGGNPLQEGILADGGWQNRMKRDEAFASVNSKLAKVAGYDDWLEQPYQDAQGDLLPEDIDCPECGTKMIQHPKNDYLAVCPNPKCRHELDMDDYARDMEEEAALRGHHYAAEGDDEFNLYRTLVDKARQIQDEQGPEAAERYIADQENNPDSAWGGDYVFDAVRQTLQGDANVPNMKQLMPQDDGSSARDFSIADMEQQALKKDRGENSSLADEDLPTAEDSLQFPEWTPEELAQNKAERQKDRVEWDKEIPDPDVTPEQQLQRSQDRLDTMDEKYGPVDQTIDPNAAPNQDYQKTIDEARNQAIDLNDKVYTPKLNWEPGQPGRGILFYGGNDKLPDGPGVINTPQGKAVLHTWPYDREAQIGSPENLFHKDYMDSLGLNTSNEGVMNGAAQVYITPEGNLESVGRTPPESLDHIMQADPRIKPVQQSGGGLAFGSKRSTPHGSWLVESEADFKMENADVLPPDDSSWEGDSACSHCGGSGENRDGSVCFDCAGSGKVSKVAIDLGGIIDNGIDKAFETVPGGGFVKSLPDKITDPAKNFGESIGLIPEDSSLGELAGSASWLLGGAGAGAALGRAAGLGLKPLLTGATSRGAGAAASLGSRAKSLIPSVRNGLALHGGMNVAQGMNPMQVPPPQPVMPARTLQQMAKVADHPSSDPIMHDDPKEHSDGDSSAAYPWDDVNDIGGTLTGDTHLDSEIDKNLPVLVMYYLSDSSARDSKDPELHDFLDRLEGHLGGGDDGDESLLEPLWDTIESQLKSLDSEPEEKTHEEKEEGEPKKEEETAIGLGTQSHSIHAELYDRYADVQNLPSAGTGNVPRPPQAPAAPQAPGAPGTAQCPRCGAPMSPGATTCPNPQCQSGVGVQQQAPQPGQVFAYAPYPGLEGQSIHPGGAQPIPQGAVSAAPCPHCGSTNTGGGPTCANCHQSVFPQMQQQPQKPTAAVGDPGGDPDFNPFVVDEYGQQYPSGQIACPHCQGAGCEACDFVGSTGVKSPGDDGFVTPAELTPDNYAIPYTHSPYEDAERQLGIPHRQGADHQGPSNGEQFSVVADLLTEEGRQDEIPGMLAEPWKYAEELARAQNKNIKPPIDESQTAMPPPPPIEETPPGAGMPVPGMESPQMPMQASQGSDHAQSILKEATEPVDHHEAENPIAAPAADQHEPEDIQQEQDSSLQWQDTNGEPLKEGQEYEMDSPSWTIPDIVIVKAVKPDGIVVEIQSEYGLNARTEIDKHENEMEQYSFTPSDASSVDQPIENSLGTPDDQRQRLAPGEQSDLSTPHMYASKEAADNVASRCPKCDSASSSLISEEGDMECNACGNKWKRDKLLQDPTYSSYRCPNGHAFAARRTASNLQCPECGSPLDPSTGLGRGVDPEGFGLQDHPSPAAFTAPEQPPISPQQETTPPQVQGKVAGAKFSPFEQREFVDESGVARNKDKLKLDGTHYAEDENDDYLLFDW